MVMDGRQLSFQWLGRSINEPRLVCAYECLFSFSSSRHAAYYAAFKAFIFHIFFWIPDYVSSVHIAFGWKDHLDHSGGCD